MSTPPSFGDRFNAFLYRQNIRKLSDDDKALAKEWCVRLIRREHPEFSPEKVERFYENLINVRWTAVDEWTQRMS